MLRWLPRPTASSARHDGQAQQHQKRNVYQYKDSAAVSARNDGKTVHISKADGASGRYQNKPRREANFSRDCSIASHHL